MQGLFRVLKEMKQAVSLTRFSFYWLQIHTNGKFLQMYFRKFVHFLFILVIKSVLRPENDSIFGDTLDRPAAAAGNLPSN